MRNESHLTMHMEYRRDIEGLRALAVLTVLAFHLDIPGFTGGFIGVDIFFVISGFLITSVIRNNLVAGTFGFSDFYSRRARRLFPALFVTIVVTFLIGVFVMSPISFSQLSYSALAALVSLSNITFWLQGGYFEDSNWTKPLLHTWSLGVEEQFYLFWPAVMVFLLPQCRKAASRIVIVSIVVTGVALTELWLSFAPGAAYFLLPFRISEFAIGAALIWLSPNAIRSFLLKEAGFIAGVIAIASSILLFNSHTKFPGVAALLPCLGTALCIYCGNSLLAQLLLANSVTVSVGRISYSLYLVHWPIIVFAKYYLLRELTVIETALTIVVIFSLAAVLHKYVEQPFRIRAGGKTFVGRNNVAVVITGCLFLVAVPMVSAQIDGWRWRLPERVANAETVALQDINYGGLDCNRAPCESTGNAVHPKIYVIGDSHARSLYAGLVQAFPTVNFIIYAPDGCGFYSTKYIASYVTTDTECRNQRALAFREISYSGAPVIIFQLWSLYVQLPHYSENNSDISLRSINALTFSNFVSTQIGEMKVQLGSRSIIVIGGLPTFANIGSPADCFARPLQSLPCATSLKRTRVDSVNGDFNSAVTAISNKTFIWIDPFQYLCDLTRCRNMTPDGQSIYADGDHLSVLGSEYLVKLLRPIIAAETSNVAMPATY